MSDCIYTNLKNKTLFFCCLSELYTRETELKKSQLESTPPSGKNEKFIFSPYCVKIVFSSLYVNQKYFDQLIMVRAQITFKYPCY